jgi:hypothetical protein
MIECSGFEKKNSKKIAKFEKSLIKFLISRKTTDYFFEKFSKPEHSLRAFLIFFGTERQRDMSLKKRKKPFLNLLRDKI